MTGRTISHYEILEKLGEGGMGVVYKARDTHLDRLVAIKVLPPEKVADPERKRRFVQEAKAASALNHPNIITIYDIDQADGIDFISMEFVAGRTLDHLIPRHGMRLNEALKCAVQIADAVAAAHGAGIVHRDLKPGNVMVTGEGHVKVLDFGLAKLTETLPAGEEGTTRTMKPTTVEGKVVGTVAYMSPEQVEGTKVDVRSDVFSFGAVLYEMLTGQRAFHGNSTISTMSAILRDAPAPVRGMRRDVPKDVERVLGRCLEKNRDVRYRSGIELRDALRAIEAGVAAKEKNLLRRPRFAVPVLAVIVLLALGGGWWYRRYSKVRWARLEAIPQIEQILQKGISRFGWWEPCEGVFRLAREAEKYVPGDPALARLMEACSHKLTVETDPAGAKVYVRHYAETSSECQLLGTTALKEVQVPYAAYRWRFEKEGYETTEAALTTFPGKLIRRTLDKAGTRPAGMVRVAGAEAEGVGILGDFYIDQYEVTNRQYKEFIDHGGYQNRSYWKNRFVKAGKVLSWEEAMAEFRDSTARPGPSTWEAGDYPGGQDDYPVSGVSWYEAAAYAEFAQKSLPTVYHWELAAGFNTFPMLLYQMSNFGRGGPVPVGSREAMNAYGAQDMAGNVREWCWNESPGGRYTRGGAWDDAPYMYGNWSQQPPWNRSPRNGLRCVRYINPDKVPGKAFGPPLYTPPRDFGKEKPVSDAVFKVYKAQFDYDPAELKVAVEEKDETAAGWTRERISFNAAYAGARVISYLYLPKKGRPPFQTVVYFPGSEAIDPGSPGMLLLALSLDFEFLVKNGRAVMHPMYSGTYERKGEMKDEDTWPGKGHEHAYTESLVKWVKDFRRCVDYLETRNDIDHGKLAFYGSSWGGVTGTIIPAAEDRIRAVILSLGGFSEDAALPEASGLNYVSRIKAPTLMLNGKYDMSFPFETSVKPAYDLLGTPKADKRLVVYDTDHYVPTKELVRESLDWLDRYLGPVR